MKESKSISLFTLLFWSIFINSKKFLIIFTISIIITAIIILSSLFPKTNLSIGIVNLDKGLTLQFSNGSISFSEKIIESLISQGNNIKRFDTLSKAVDLLNTGKITLILYFPENYTLFTHLANFSKSSSVKPRIFIYANEKKISKEIKLELFTAFSQMVETKIIPLEIIETITNKELPKNYFVLSIIIIIIFLFSILASYNFGYYLLSKSYDEFLAGINQSFMPIIIILSVLLSLAFFILISIGLTLYSLITKELPFFGYAYLPLNIFFLSFSASILGYLVAFIFKKNNYFILISFILFAFHFMTFPIIETNTIFTKIISYILPSILVIKKWYWILSLNISPLEVIYLSIIYSVIYMSILLLIFLIMKLLKNKFKIYKSLIQRT